MYFFQDWKEVGYTRDSMIFFLYFVNLSCRHKNRAYKHRISYWGRGWGRRHHLLLWRLYQHAVFLLSKSWPGKSTNFIKLNLAEHTMSSITKYMVDFSIMKSKGLTFWPQTGQSKLEVLWWLCYIKTLTSLEHERPPWQHELLHFPQSCSRVWRGP